MRAASEEASEQEGERQWRMQNKRESRSGRNRRRGCRAEEGKGVDVTMFLAKGRFSLHALVITHQGSAQILRLCMNVTTNMLCHSLATLLHVSLLRERGGRSSPDS